MQALTRSLGWKIIQREFGRQRERMLDQIMSASTDSAVRDHLVLVQSGRDEVLGFPVSEIDNHIQHNGQAPAAFRAGVGPVAEEA